MRRVAALIGLTVLVAASCGDAAPDAAGQPVEIVVTTSIIGDVVARIVGDSGEVSVIMGPGVDPHDFAPSAAEAAGLRDADLVVANGLGLEGPLATAVDAAAEDGANVVELARHVDEVVPPAGDVVDAHFWHDPHRMVVAIGVVVDRLSDLGVVPEEELRAAADRYVAEILEVDAECEEVLEAVPPARRKLVTNHASLGAFADRYGFEVVGTVIPGGSTLGEPSAAGIADLAAVIEATGVRAVFVDKGDPGRLAEALAAEVGDGVAVHELFTDALGEEGSGAETYLGLLETNARIVADALGGST